MALDFLAGCLGGKDFPEGYLWPAEAIVALTLTRAATLSCDCSRNFVQLRGGDVFERALLRGAARPISRGI